MAERPVTARPPRRRASAPCARARRAHRALPSPTLVARVRAARGRGRIRRRRSWTSSSTGAGAFAMARATARQQPRSTARHRCARTQSRARRTRGGGQLVRWRAGAARRGLAMQRARQLARTARSVRSGRVARRAPRAPRCKRDRCEPRHARATPRVAPTTPRPHAQQLEAVLARAAWPVDGMSRRVVAVGRRARRRCCPGGVRATAGLGHGPGRSAS